MNNDDLLAIFRTLTLVSFWSWVLFFGLEFLRPSLVMRVFSPHLFLVGFFVGLFGWVVLLSKK